MSRGMRLLLALLAGAVAFVLGCFFGAGVAGGNRFPGRVESVPLPHHVPKSPTAATFRFAMAHDVIHERYPKHGPAFYRERERLAHPRLAQIPENSDEAFGLIDDIAVGMVRTGKLNDAIPILRNKLKLQERRGLSGRDLYTTYANLGALVFHANLAKAIDRDAAARAGASEGLDMVRQSVKVNPEAHFGREQWQVVNGEFLMASCSDPKLLTKFDFVGNRIDVYRDDGKESDYTRYSRNEANEFGRACNFNFKEGGARDLLQYKPFNHFPDSIPVGERQSARYGITEIGAEKDWSDVAVPSLRKPVPFDEPMLGIVGMWRQGEGATPHFCLCIGETMLRVGQRRIAWTAYERGKQLSERFWPKPEIQKAFREHCDRRQKEIEKTLPADEVATLRPNFEDELAYGLRYQKEYQDFEAAKIAAGADIVDEHFFDDFHKGHEPI